MNETCEKSDENPSQCAAKSEELFAENVVRAHFILRYSKF